MTGQVGELQGIQPRYSDDVARIESAVRKLLAFCEGQMEALNEEAVPQTAPLHTPSAKPTRGTLLVADDSPHNCEILRRNLERTGYTVETVNDGAAALQRLRKSVFDLVLLMS
jgi:PleD family two-component response regulator